MGLQNKGTEMQHSGLKMEEGLLTQECGQPPEDGKDKETDSSLEPPERNTIPLTPQF